MSFGFGPLPGLPANVSMDDLARLFGGAPMGAGQGFSGSATGPIPATEQLQAPDAVAPQAGMPMPPPRPAGFGFGPVPTAPQPEAAPAMPQSAVITNPPAPPPRPLSFGALPTPEADMPAVGAVPTAGTMPAPAAAGEKSGFNVGDIFRNISASGADDMLIGLGTGLMSTRGFGNGLAAGFQNAQRYGAQRSATDLARTELALKQQKLAKEASGQNSTRAYFKSVGMSDELADAAMSNPTVLSSAMAQINKDPSRVTIGGNIYELKPGQRPDQSNLLGPAEADRDKQTLVDVRQPDGTIVKSWIKPGEASGVPVGAPVRTGVQLLDTPEKRAAAGIQPTDTRTARIDAEGKVSFDPAPPAPTVHVLEDENGIKHIRQYDPQSQRWVDPAQPPGAPPAPTNPLALKGKTTNEQSKAAGFSDRMLGSESILASKEAQGTDFWQRMKDNVPLVGNYMTSDEYQSYGQAKRDFINAQLRRESGAAIGKDEFASADKQYFPQPGDGEGTIKQKAANRRTAIEAMIREGGTTYLPGKVFNETGALVPFGPGQRSAAAQPPAPAAQAPSGGPARPQSQSDYAALPSGAQYIAPDGSVRKKP